MVDRYMNEPAVSRSPEVELQLETLEALKAMAVHGRGQDVDWDLPAGRDTLPQDTKMHVVKDLPREKPEQGSVHLEPVVVHEQTTGKPFSVLDWFPWNSKKADGKSKDEPEKNPVNKKLDASNKEAGTDKKSSFWDWLPWSSKETDHIKSTPPSVHNQRLQDVKSSPLEKSGQSSIHLKPVVAYERTTEKPFSVLDWLPWNSKKADGKSKHELEKQPLAEKRGASNKETGSDKKSSVWDWLPWSSKETDHIKSTPPSVKNQRLQDVKGSPLEKSGQSSIHLKPVVAYERTTEKPFSVLDWLPWNSKKADGKSKHELEKQPVAEKRGASNKESGIDKKSSVWDWLPWSSKDTDHKKSTPPVSNKPELAVPPHHKSHPEASTTQSNNGWWDLVPFFNKLTKDDPAKSPVKSSSPAEGKVHSRSVKPYHEKANTSRQDFSFTDWIPTDSENVSFGSELGTPTPASLRKTWTWGENLQPYGQKQAATGKRSTRDNPSLEEPNQSDRKSWLNKKVAILDEMSQTAVLSPLVKSLLHNFKQGQINTKQSNTSILTRQTRLDIRRQRLRRTEDAEGWHKLLYFNSDET